MGLLLCVLLQVPGYSFSDLFAALEGRMASLRGSLPPCDLLTVLEAYDLKGPATGH